MKTVKILIMENLVERLRTRNISEYQFLYLTMKTFEGNIYKVRKELKNWDTHEVD